MTELTETAASLRFYGDDLDPDPITKALGAHPTVGVSKGGVWHTSTGAPKVARYGFWMLHVPRRRPGDLDGQVIELLSQLTQDLSVWKDLTTRFNSNIFLGFFLREFNEGIGLKPETSLMVGQRGLLLNFDIYSGKDDPDEDDE